MDGTGFDPRYPAEFQRGGDALPRAFDPPAEAPQTTAAEEAKVPSGVGRAGSPDTGGQENEPVWTARTRPWTAWTWVLGLGAAVVTILLGVLCLLPKANPVADASAGNPIVVGLFFPLTDKVLALGPFLAIAGMGMLLVMFLGGAARYPRASRWLWAAATVVPVVALVAAGLALFATTLHPEIVFNSAVVQNGAAYVYPWFPLLSLATMPLVLFGLFAGAAVAVVGPNVQGGISLSVVRAAATGAALLVGAVVTFYAPEIFTGSMFADTFRSGDASMPLTPWPVTLMQLGPYLLLVGLAALLLALFLRLTTGPGHRTQIDHVLPAGDVENETLGRLNATID